MRREKRKGLLCLGLVLAMLITQLTGYVPAQAEGKDKANLRIIFTTDLHGQVNNIDYSTGSLLEKGGLSKAVTLVNEARAEVGAANTCLFDLGDVMYDYTTDYIYDYDEKEVQPIFQAMASMGYDAITMGNHDFEYTQEYIQYQYNATGLTDKVVVSNVTDANTGAHPWNENKIIQKSLTTAYGKTINVKVGVIGETIPTLSKKRCDYTGILAGEDIVQNVTREAAALKSQGADIVVVLAHSGIGDEYPAAMDEDVAYALTKIDGVDVVLSGHKHAYFCGNGTTAYDSYAGVDTKTGLVNGKNLVMIANSGAAIGQVDLSVYTEGGVVYVGDRSSKIRKVKADTESDPTISAYMDKWGKTFLADATQVICEMDSSDHMDNYFGTVEDTGVIQLLNDISITYGMEYKNNTNTAYKDMPVVAASRYSKYGAGSGSDYYNISGYFTKADLYQLMNYRIQLYLYAVTGSQLKEWLEWSASAYETAGNVIEIPDAEESPSPSGPPFTDPATDAAVTTGPAATVSPEETTKPATGGEVSMPEETEASDETDGVVDGIPAPSDSPTSTLDRKNLPEGILNYSGSKPLQYALQEEYFTDLSHYYIMDGIEYHIDTTVEPRYDYDGKKIRDTHRVDRVTRNGVEIQDTDQFLFVVNRLIGTTVPDQFSNQMIDRLSAANTREYFEAYFDRQSMCGALKSKADDNWSISFSDDYSYVVKSGVNSGDVAATKPWITETLDSAEGFNFYLADFSKQNRSDNAGPDLVIRALKEIETNQDVKVVVQASDASGLHSVRYLKGKYTKDSIAWDNATYITDSFTCSENSIYSVMAMDVYGNKTIRYVRINNINKSILEAPKVDTYTNRKTAITGTAEPVATIYFEVDNGDIFHTTVKDDGTFSYELPAQKADTKVYVYVKDDEGRASARTVVTVKRTGPNKPVLDKVTTAVRTLTGELNDINVYPVFILESKKTLFMQDDDTETLYKNSELYATYQDYEIEKIDMGIKEDGSYSFKLPYLLTADTAVKMRTLDVAYRNSMGTKRVVQQTVPAEPTVNKVTNLTTTVKIFSEEKCKSATLTVGKKKYTITKSTYVQSKKMYRYSKKIARTDSGVKVEAYLTNVAGNSPVYKTTKAEMAPDTPVVNSIKAGQKKITGRVDVVGDGSAEEGVTVSNTKTRVFVYVNGKKYEASVSFEGNFKLKLKKKLVAGTKIVVKARNLRGVSLKRTIKI